MLCHDGQVKTALDYGHDNPVMAFLCGALNYQARGVGGAPASSDAPELCGSAPPLQIEHHLFPGISQYHYPAIARLVQARSGGVGEGGCPDPLPHTPPPPPPQSACAAHGIPYRYERSFFGAFRAHVQHLWEMGQRGEAAHID